MIRLAVQSRLVPGDSLREKHERALSYGFDGIELSGFPMIELAREAVRDVVPVTAMCSGHRGWFIDPDPAQIAACLEDVETLLGLSAELDGAPLIVVPIYGRTNRLPDCGTGRSPGEIGRCGSTACGVRPIARTPSGVAWWSRRSTGTRTRSRSPSTMPWRSPAPWRAPACGRWATSFT